MLQVAAEVCEPFTEGDERDKAIQSIVNRLRVGNLWIGRAQIRDAEKIEFSGEFSGDSDTSSLVSSLVNPPTRLSVLRRAAKGLAWSSGDLPSHLVNERLRTAAKSAGINCGTSVDWKKAVSTALKGIGAKSKKSRSPSGRLIWLWSMGKQPQDQKPDQNQDQNQDQKQEHPQADTVM